MNSTTIKLVASFAAIAAIAAVGCSSAPETDGENQPVPAVETDNTDPNRWTGARVVNTSGSIGGIGGYIETNPLPPPPHLPPISCGGSCTPAGDGCACPLGTSLTSTGIICPGGTYPKLIMGKYYCVW